MRKGLGFYQIHFKCTVRWQIIKKNKYKKKKEEKVGKEEEELN